MKAVLLFCALCVMPVSVSAQQRTPPTAAQRAAYEARRDSLENVVVGKFVDRLARDLKLSAPERTQVEKVLAESGVRRHELLKASSSLRTKMRNATRDSATADAVFMTLLAEQDALRNREHQLWSRDQEEMARVLNPRQRVLFISAWSSFQDDMRRIVSEGMRPSGSRDERHPR